MAFSEQTNSFKGHLALDESDSLQKYIALHYVAKLGCKKSQERDANNCLLSRAILGGLDVDALGNKYSLDYPCTT